MKHKPNSTQLLKLRKEHGLRQIDAARFMCRSHRQVQRYEADDQEAGTDCPDVCLELLKLRLKNGF